MKNTTRSFGRRRLLTLIGAGGIASALVEAQKSSSKTPAAAKPDACNCTLAADGTPLDTGASELRPVIERYSVELRDYERVYPLPGSAARQAALEKFYSGQLHLLEEIRFNDLSQPGKVDYLLLRGRLLQEQKAVLAEKEKESEVAALIPFQQTIIGFEESRRRMDTVDGQKCALAIEKMLKEIAVAKDLLSGAKGTPAMNRAAQRLALLRSAMRTWYNFYALYDPRFVWWTEASYKKADAAIEAHAELLHKTSGVGGTLEAVEFGGRGGFGGGRGPGGGGGRGGTRRSSGPLGSDEELSGLTGRAGGSPRRAPHRHDRVHARATRRPGTA